MHFKRIVSLFLFPTLFLFLLFSCDDHDPEKMSSAQEEDLCIPTRSSGSGTVVEGRYIVSFQDDGENTNGKSAAKAARVFEKNNLQQDDIINEFTGAYSHYVIKLSKEQVSNLELDSSVSAIEPDRRVSICACFTVIEPRLITWNTDKTGYGDGTGKTAWLLDTGIDLNHPDLNIDSRSRSFLPDQKTAQDDNGHGTHVAGIIGAKNNTIGTLGIAADATLIALKVLDQDGKGYLSTVLDALAYVRKNASKGSVVNISLGLDESSKILETELREIANAGIFITVAAGNDGEPAKNFSPANINGKNIYTVTAVDSLNRFAKFSNYGNDVVDVTAPGIRILSSYLNGKYAIMSGTSMAAPHVAGILLVNDGELNFSGHALNDPDGVADPIVRK